jgi:hypothetical protein
METKAKHTPGPWQLRLRIRDSAIIETDDRTIATTLHYGDTDKQADANARLLAAAPELLEACKAALSELAMPEISMEGRLQKVLRAAIAKAEDK